MLKERWWKRDSFKKIIDLVNREVEDYECVFVEKNQTRYQEVP